MKQVVEVLDVQVFPAVVDQMLVKLLPGHCVRVWAKHFLDELVSYGLKDDFVEGNFSVEIVEVKGFLFAAFAGNFGAHEEQHS